MALPIVPFAGAGQPAPAPRPPTKAAYTALLTGEFPDPVTIRLPGGETPAFALAWEARGAGECAAGVIKDAGDDPDVTHGALIIATVRRGEAGSGVVFRAGEGVGMVTKEGLPIPPGEPAINPVPRRMMTEAVAELAAEFGDAGDVVIEVSVPGGAEIALKTWNPRLGIVGGLSILGTTGIVVPFSCSAWIHSIHRGIDVARANGIDHVAGSTGSTSEQAVQRIHGLSELALLDMGDFAGGMLKYLRRNPVPRVTIAGGFGKLTKLAQGFPGSAFGAESGRFHVAGRPAGGIGRACRAGGRGADRQYRQSGADQSHRRRSAACRSGRGAGA